MVYHSAIIGAGAAGLFCASRIAQGLSCNESDLGSPQKSVIVLDHGTKIGEKIRISGGGRCNFTNTLVEPQHFISENPHFVRSALARYSPDDFIKLVKAYGIAYYEKELGQLFTRDGAQLIIDLLLKECERYGVSIRFPISVNTIEHDGALFRINSDGTTIEAHNLIIATGGLSIPKIGATDFGYRIARQFNHRIIEPRPALVPLTLEPEHRAPFDNLAGTSLAASVRVEKQAFNNQVLFTHNGYSGPAILQISSYWQHARKSGANKPIHIRFVSDEALSAWRDQYAKSNMLLSNALESIVPNRFAERVINALGVNPPMSQLSKKTAQSLSALLCDFSLEPDGTAGFAKAEVTLGGVSCADLSSKTMESKHQAGLFFIGEVVDVTGHLGGYNFQWAWSSAVAAADALATRHY